MACACGMTQKGLVSMKQNPNLKLENETLRLENENLKKLKEDLRSIINMQAEKIEELQKNRVININHSTVTIGHNGT
jgi:hypothetical protein